MKQVPPKFLEEERLGYHRGEEAGVASLLFRVLKFVQPGSLYEKDRLYDEITSPQVQVVGRPDRKTDP